MWMEKLLNKTRIVCKVVLGRHHLSAMGEYDVIVAGLAITAVSTAKPDHCDR